MLHQTFCPNPTRANDRLFDRTFNERAMNAELVTTLIAVGAAFLVAAIGLAAV